MRPIIAPDMKQLVAGNRGLESSVHGGETFGKKNDWRLEAKSDGRIDGEGETEFGAGVHASGYVFEDGCGYRKKRNWRGCLPELAKSQNSDGKEGEAYGDSNENYASEDLGDGFEAGKMPV